MNNVPKYSVFLSDSPHFQCQKKTQLVVNIFIFIFILRLWSACFSLRGRGEGAGAVKEHPLYSKYATSRLPSPSWRTETFRVLSWTTSTAAPNNKKAEVRRKRRSSRLGFDQAMVGLELVLTQVGWGCKTRGSVRIGCLSWKQQQLVWAVSWSKLVWMVVKLPNQKLV